MKKKTQLEFTKFVYDFLKNIRLLLILYLENKLKDKNLLRNN